MRERFWRHTVCIGGTLVVVAEACATSSSDSGPSPRPVAPPDAGSAPASPTPTDGGITKQDDPPDPPEGPSIRYTGRFDTRVPEEPRCGWPGCRIIARFEGASVSVKLVEHVDDWMLGGPSEWDYAVDGVWQKKLVLWRGEQTVKLAEKLGPGPHEVELFKRSEAQTGVTGFAGFDFGEGGILLSPPPRKKRNIELVGDSMLTGFGIEGVGPVCPVADQAAQWANFHRSFGVLIGENVDADVRGTAYSGKGITKNIWRPDPWTMPKLFPLANPIDPTSTFEIGTYAPNLVLVGIGGLDFAVGQPVDDGPAALPTFIDGYAAFMTDLRNVYPNAHILCIVGPGTLDEGVNVIHDSAAAGVTGAVEKRKAAGDTKISVYLPASVPRSEVTGCNGHGNPAFHERIAKELTPIIRAAVGW